MVHPILGHNTKPKKIGIFPLIPKSSVPDLIGVLMWFVQLERNHLNNFRPFLRKKEILNWLRVPNFVCGEKIPLIDILAQPGKRKKFKKTKKIKKQTLSVLSFV